eukprot:CAMPEP_0197233918 /NCGR_PEP_ID=MMETSP1429-20130617/1832_1 /TAXON_ID=49237 /ORGANISM="Chaetoceros  sp., Strain UNC1202" /LENGTH=143 /DNA_ID=CAMNT_0042692235 /DNA_START=40 /DNA_END=471 /DNA_ORIENTATION=+
MFSRAASTLRNSARTAFRQSTRAQNQNQQRRNMGGGSHWMEVSEVHTQLGEVFGFVCWMWIFHRARNDLPVVLGWRHPWEHAEDPWAGNYAIEDNVEGIEELRKDWDEFTAKAIIPGDGDDDDDEEDDDDEDDDEEDDDDDEE